ncbi:interleukin-1 beta-like [Pelodytes ibericus]
MAQVPEFDSYLMDSYSEHEDIFYEDYSCETKKNIQDSQWFSCHSSCSACTSPVQLQVTNHIESPYSFKKAVVLVVAIEKLKRGISGHRLFQDTDLINLLNDIFVQEDISIENAAITHSSPSRFSLHSTSECWIKDLTQKCMALQQFRGNAQLVAVHLQGLNTKREETISMSFYRSQNLDRSMKQPVTLGLAGRNLYLSCTLAGDEPQLHLEEVANIKDISNEDLQRFIFLRSENGLSNASTFNFESLAHPDWYISTSQRGNEVVRMKSKADQTFIKEFFVFDKQ